MTREIRLTILKAQNGNKEAMSKLIDDNIKLIWNIVKKFNNRGFEEEDLFQIGCEGFIKAIKKFNFEFETQLSTYLVPVIMGEIKRYIRDDGIIKISRSIKELSYKIYECKERYLREKGEEITINKLSEELKVSKDEIIEAMESNIKPEYLENTFTNDDDSQNLYNTLSNNVDESEIAINNVMIRDVLSTLNERDKKIILLRYYRQKSQTEISKLLGISQVQVSRLEKRILEEMKQKI